MNVIVSGGGTGGHIYPALTLINAIKLKRPDTKFLYVGTNHGLEADIVPKAGLNFVALDINGGFERRLTIKNFSHALEAFLNIRQVYKIIKSFQPQVVVGTGGYVCGSILLTASLMGIPTLIQEQNAVAGITNKILSRFVTRIVVGTKATLKFFPHEKTFYIGNPIRTEILTAEKKVGLKKFNFVDDKPIVLVYGGSRGARSINKVMVKILKSIAEENKIQILHITGKSEFKLLMQELQDSNFNLTNFQNIKIVPYVYDMAAAMAMADLVVSRAGATGLAELNARGIPAILIPYPYATENHQESNAQELVKAGAARMILNRDLTSELLLKTLSEILSSPKELKKMSIASFKLGKPNAANEIADMILRISER